MADKALTQSEIVAQLATATGFSKVQVRGFLESQSKLAYKNAKNGYTVAGLGKLVLVARKARMGRNPATGEAIKIPAKKVVKFRVAKAAKDSIVGATVKKAAPKKKK
jgi:DNA-binding protein HU-beta